MFIHSHRLRPNETDKTEVDRWVDGHKSSVVHWQRIQHLNLFLVFGRQMRAGVRPMRLDVRRCSYLSKFVGASIPLANKPFILVNCAASVCYRPGCKLGKWNSESIVMQSISPWSIWRPTSCEAEERDESSCNGSMGMMMSGRRLFSRCRMLHTVHYLFSMLHFLLFCCGECWIIDLWEGYHANWVE
jgi:hypothetical protein